MSQTTLSVTLEVVPESAGRLSSLVQQLQASGSAKTYPLLKSGVPSLHFMSMSVFRDNHYDPLFVIEVNFDGSPGPFWAEMEAALGPDLRSMLRCCKRPMDEDGPLFDAVTCPDSRYPIAPYLERRTLAPSVFHHGNRGLTRNRILQEGALFLATRSELAQPKMRYRSLDPQKIHASLRQGLLPQFAWLDEAAPARISTWERSADFLRLFAFLGVVLFVISTPGLLLLVFLQAFAPNSGPGPLLALLLAPVLAAVVIYKWWRPRSGEAAPARSGGLSPSTLNKATSLANPYTLLVTGLVYLALLALALALVLASAASLVETVAHALVDALSAFHAALDGGVGQAIGRAGHAFAYGLPAFGGTFERLWWGTLQTVCVGLYSAVVFTLPALVVWLRWLERRDSYHDDPPIDIRELRRMTEREDWIPQNHMGSVVVVKPGVLRTLLFRTGHLGLGLVLRVVATDGYLGSMRTVHFAHWAFVNNGSRLMFFSNFDHSWDSYLDDFIEKAHGGLTLAWGSCIGFPPTRFLVLDGASHGRQFKAWARNSMSVSSFWFSAYEQYTVDQIERHARIADGLRQRSLTSNEAEQWIRDL